MRRRFSLLAAFLLSSFLTPVSQATVLINPPGSAYPVHVLGDGATQFSIEMAGNNGGNPQVGSKMNTSAGYRAFINTNPATATAADRIYIDVSSNAAFPANSLIGVTVSNASGPITLRGAGSAGGIDPPLDCGAAVQNCFTDSKAAIYYVNSTLRLSFSVSDLCNLDAAQALCNGNAFATIANSHYSGSFTVKFAVVTDYGLGSNVTSSTSTNDSATFVLGVGDVVPQLGTTTCPSTFFFPGDSQIYFFQSAFSGASGGSGGAPDFTPGASLQYLVAMANSGSVSDAASGGLTSNPIVAYAPVGQSQITIDGFVNATTPTNNKYNLIVQPQNLAGLVGSGTTANDPSCVVQSQAISGILNESKCFIATAAFHDGRAAPVMMLRKFRDQILSRFSFGQDFIKTYYHYSPAVAEWAWDKPIIRSFALRLLAPVELMAWAVLKFSSAEEIPVNESPESYIDRVKKNLPPEENTSTGSYSEQEKKKLESNSQDSPDAKGSYIDRLKKQLGDNGKPETSDGSYSEKEKSKLPANVDRESPIQMVKEGRDHKLGLPDAPPIESAAGFRLGVTPGTKVNVVGGAHTYEQVYGTGYHPELDIHYEHQFFHSENFGSFGVGTDFGVAYDGGQGLLQFGFNGSNQSKTGFGFFQLPVLIDAIYRFNLLRLLRPYVSVGAGAMGYMETRTDTKPNKRGMSAIYSGTLGVSLLLDFLDSSTHRDSFMSYGIQHTYLFAEYVYLNTFKNTVTFQRSGIYSGFTFEF